MIDTIYIEEGIKNHPRTQEILARFPSATRISCERYGEIFNRNQQNFRLQKMKPAFILAEKFDHFVLDAPMGYGIGGDQNFYFSHMLNCIYDCRYCFLQGMYRSANYVLFVNYEDFASAIEEKISATKGESYFFSGYDCDSLALEPVTHFAEFILPFFRRHPNAWLELRTKSIQIKTLLQMEPIANCVVAFSLNPESVIQKLEDKTPSLKLRLEAMETLGKAGWKLGLRFDPLIYHDGFEIQYEKLFKEVFTRIDSNHIHSVSFGSFRLPKNIYDTMFRTFPDEKLFSGPLSEREGMVSYSNILETKMLEWIRKELLDYIPEQLFFPCSVN